ncbi:MAG: hypothetical protein QOI01_2312 [Mycobacterium sp.]|nr:hypothetical protein [Mycobacterium sp.]
MPYDPASWQSERARLAHLVCYHAPESEITESRRNYRALRLADHLRKQLAANPPLNDEQRARIADLLLDRRGCSVSDMTPAERSMRAQLGAHALWAKTDDRAARTQAARRGFYRRFERQADPEGTLDPAERARRAEHLRKAHMLKLSMASAKARRLRGQSGGAQ